jgi:hypothetical protein
MLVVILLAALQATAHGGQAVSDPSARLALYGGAWTVKAKHPWGGGPPGTQAHLASHCERFNSYFTCEQTIDGKPQGLLIYTATRSPGKLHSRFIAPDGLAGGRGDVTLDGNHWTYLDKPPVPLEGNWSRVENFILDHDHIRFEDYESSDKGKTWTKTNGGIEERTAP